MGGKAAPTAAAGPPMEGGAGTNFDSRVSSAYQSTYEGYQSVRDASQLPGTEDAPDSSLPESPDWDNVKGDAPGKTRLSHMDNILTSPLLDDEEVETGVGVV